MKLLDQMTSVENGSNLLGKLMTASFATLFGILALPGVCAAQEARPALVTSLHGSGGVHAADTMTSQGSLGQLTDQPITAGEVVHISVFGAPDFTVTTRVAENGDVPYPMLGQLHLAGLNSADAATNIEKRLKQADLLADPHVLVTVDGSAGWITVLGEVRNPGIYPPLGKHQLSDVLAAAGGLTANTGRVIEISNPGAKEKKEYVAWDPTMHNTQSYDRTVEPGDRVIVRGCGIAYIGGKVAKPGAYSLCGSTRMTLSEVVALAGGNLPLSADKHTYIIRSAKDGTRTVQEIDLGKVLHARAIDPIVREDDMIYVSPSTIKSALSQFENAAIAVAPPLLYVVHP